MENAWRNGGLCVPSPRGYVNARLEGLLLLFGCGDEIAPFDVDALAERAGELIANVSSYQPKPLLPSSMSSKLTRTRSAAG
jgi:hypothetical protein